MQLQPFKTALQGIAQHYQGSYDNYNECSQRRICLWFPTKNSSKFTFFSSSEIYGNPDNKNVPTSESYRGNVATSGPRACYDESKRLGETLCYIYNKEYKVHTNCIRPFNVYGPGMKKNDYRVLPNFAQQIKKAKS